MGPSSNPSTAHACVSVRLANGFIGDMQISRLASPVRLLADEERQSVAALQLESWRDTYGSLATPEYLAALPSALQERWRTMTFGPREFVLVGAASHDDSTMDDGSSSSQPLPPIGGFVTVLDRDEHAFVDNLHVGLRARREGLGRRLMAVAAARMQEYGYERVRLTVLASNAGARAFYERLGGVEVDEREVEFVGRRLMAIELEWRDLERLARCG